MTTATQQRIATALHLIEGHAALMEAQFADGKMTVPTLPLSLAAVELAEALRLEGATC